MRLSRLVLGLLLLPLTAFAADAELERFVDGAMGAWLNERRTAGAAVAVVEDGEARLVKGYGLADVENAVPVDARSTAFRVGSVSKVLVWMAVLQQVEARRVELDEDVNTYLETLRIPPTQPDPVTLRHLMTHTPGFEDRLNGLFLATQSQMRPLVETLREAPPRRLWLPGTVVAYSNYGAALAAHVVENVAGLEWDPYLERYLLAPLGMTATSARQPAPEELDVATGYRAVDGRFERGEFEYVSQPPAGALSATALDVARLMAELLDPLGTEVLSAESKQMLLATARREHPGINGMTLGLYELTLGGPRAVGHGGDTLLFHSRMVLWPERRLGLFVTTNTDIGSGVADAFVQTFAAYHGLARRQERLRFDFDPAPYVGEYMSTRREESSWFKLLSLGIGDARVDYDPVRRELLVGGLGQVGRYGLLEDDLFGEVDGYRRAGFVRDDEGFVTGLHLSSIPVFGFERAPRERTVGFNATLLAAVIVINVAVLLWPLGSWRHRRRRGISGQGIAALFAVAGLGLVGVMLAGAATSATDASDFILYGAARIERLLWLPVALAAVAIVQLVYAYRAWVRRFWWWLRRLHYTLLATANLAFSWWCWYWKLLPPVLAAL